MSTQTAAAVLAKAAIYDQRFREPDRAVVMAWAEALGDLDTRKALDAVTAHYREETRTIMPADVVKAVRGPKVPHYWRPAAEVMAELEARSDARSLELER